MPILLPLENMTREDKLDAMEILWRELGDETYVSPAWHIELLADSERLVADGEATFSNWEEAKQRIGKQASPK